MRIVRRVPIALLLVVSLALSSCGDTYQVAASVGGDTISHADVRDLADLWRPADAAPGVPPSAADAALAELLTNFGVTDYGTSAAPSVEFMGLVLEIEIGFRIPAVQADAAEIEISSGDVEQARTDLAANLVSASGGALFSNLDEELQDYIAVGVATQNAVDAAQAAAQESFPQPSVDVNDRYGSFDFFNGFLGPEGPRPAPVG